jgi:hypothetical protein
MFGNDNKKSQNYIPEEINDEIKLDERLLPLSSKTFVSPSPI